MIADVANSVGFEDTMTFILPLLDEISHDSEPAIKQQLVEQLRALGVLLAANGDRGYTALLEIILPLTANLLSDTKAEVRQTAAGTLVKLAELIHSDDLGQHVLTIVLRLAHEDDKEEMRMTAAQLLNLLVDNLGQDLCKQFVIPEVVSLAEDPVFRVRKSTALNFHHICRVGGDYELFERLMPAFVRLSKDDMYRVRRACAESVFAISEHVSDDIRIGVLVEIYLRFAQDPARLVKQSILQQSGMFISTLPARIVNETILGHYISMASDPTGDLIVDAELKHYCAFSFPAVLQTITSSRWSELRELYHILIQCRAPNVRQSMAASLHEIARLLSNIKGLVEEELVPVFEELIQDVESVQMGVMVNLAIFLSYLSEPCRISYLPELHNILHATNPFNWRLRQCLAIQLPVLLDLPPTSSLYVTLFPLVMTLLQDPVASVKKSSFRGVSKMLYLLYKLTPEYIKAQAQAAAASASVTDVTDDDSNSNSNSNSNSSNHVDDSDSRRHQQQFDSVLKAVNGLALGDKYQSRQLWADLCSNLLKFLPTDLFEKYFLDGLLLLVSDNISNVRIAISGVFCSWGPEYKAPWEETEKDSLLKEGSIDEGKTSTDDDNEKKKEIVATSSSSSTATAIAATISDSEFRHDKNPWLWFLERNDIKECIKRLIKDHPDVVINMANLKVFFPDMQIELVNCRGLHEAPGSSGLDQIINDTTGMYGGDSFRKHYGIDDRSSTTSEVSSVELEPLDIENANKRLSGRRDEYSSLTLPVTVGGGSGSDMTMAGGVDDGLPTFANNRNRSNSPTLEEALEVEEKALFAVAGAGDRTSKLEEEENQSSDPEFLPIKDPMSEDADIMNDADADANVDVPTAAADMPPMPPQE